MADAFPQSIYTEDRPLKRLIFAVSVILLLLACFTACADPAMTDGTVTAWIGENNYFFLTTTEGQPKQLSAPMKEILSINDSDVIALTHENQIIAVKKDGSSFSYLSLNATGIITSQCRP